jgi:DNA-binding NtrC family response regulator
MDIMMTTESNVCSEASTKPDRIARAGQMVAAAPAARMWARQQLQVDAGPSAHPGVPAGIANLPTQLPALGAHRRKANFAPAVTADNGPGSGNDYPNYTIISIAEVEKRAILGTIRQLNGDKPTAARLLGIGKTTLYRKLKEYSLTEAAKSNDN